MSRAYLIDPLDESVSELRNVKDVAQAIGAVGLELLQIGSVTRNDQQLVRLGLYVEDDAYYVRNQKWFTFGAYPYPLGGRALLVGMNDLNKITDAPLDMDIIWEMVTWLGAETPKLPDLTHYAADGKATARFDQNDIRDRLFKAEDESDAVR